MDKKKDHLSEKSNLHPRNKHRERYDFKKLSDAFPDLSPFVKLNEYGDLSIDFFDPKAVKVLNQALLKYFYHIDHWDFPSGYLCPPIPGRVDYLHYVADLLAEKNKGKIPKGKKIKCLDIGVGANCIYPILGVKEYGWSFIATDIDPLALESATQIVNANPDLQGKIECRHQTNPQNIFKGIIQKDDRMDLTIANPPFHTSPEEAAAHAQRKVSHLKKRKIKEVKLNFGGQSGELWTEGGEKRFVKDMILESKSFATSCFWFTSLVSKQSNLPGICNFLETQNPEAFKIIPMGQGNKISRILAWTFLKPKQQSDWIKYRFN